MPRSRTPPTAEEQQSIDCRKVKYGEYRAKCAAKPADCELVKKCGNFGVGTDAWPITEWNLNREQVKVIGHDNYMAGRKCSTDVMFADPKLMKVIKDECKWEPKPKAEGGAAKKKKTTAPKKTKAAAASPKKAKAAAASPKKAKAAAAAPKKGGAPPTLHQSVRQNLLNSVAANAAKRALARAMASDAARK